MNISGKAIKYPSAHQKPANIQSRIIGIIRHKGTDIKTLTPILNELMNISSLMSFLRKIFGIRNSNRVGIADTRASGESSNKPNPLKIGAPTPGLWIKSQSRILSLF